MFPRFTASGNMPLFFTSSSNKFPERRSIRTTWRQYRAETKPIAAAETGSGTERFARQPSPDLLPLAMAQKYVLKWHLGKWSQEQPAVCPGSLILSPPNWETSWGTLQDPGKAGCPFRGCNSHFSGRRTQADSPDMSNTQGQPCVNRCISPAN